jgi:hypothetical protein
MKKEKTGLSGYKSVRFSLRREELDILLIKNDNCR